MDLFGLTYPIYIILIFFILFYTYFYSYIKLKINSNVENFTDIEGHFSNQCTNLDFNKCLKTSYCGWLIDGTYLSKCLPGTPDGPLNPKLQIDAESSKYGNIQNDRWIYSQNPFIFFFE
jgi:hypothetical protein